MHIQVKDEVSMTIYMDRRAYKRKLPKCLQFKNLQFRITKYLMCIYGGHVCICISNKVSFVMALLLVGAPAAESAAAGSQ